MIKNEKEYEYSQECARKFEYSIRALEQDEELKKKDPEGWQLSGDVKQSHLMALQAEIAEYDRLTAYRERVTFAISINTQNNWGKGFELLLAKSAKIMMS